MQDGLGGSRVEQIATLLRRWPRTSAALGFGAAGVALSLLWWSPIIFRAHGALPFALFIGTPGISAAAAGWALGKPLFDLSPGYSREGHPSRGHHRLNGLAALCSGVRIRLCLNPTADRT